MRAFVAAVVVGLLTGCGSVALHPPAATSQPSSIAGASPSPSATPPTTSPSLAGQALSCRLPVIWTAKDGFKGGFLSFPDHVLTVDPNASSFYDRAFAKWLLLRGPRFHQTVGGTRTPERSPTRTQAASCTWLMSQPA